MNRSRREADETMIQLEDQKRQTSCVQRDGELELDKVRLVLNVVGSRVEFGHLQFAECGTPTLPPLTPRKYSQNFLVSAYKYALLTD